MLSGGGAGALIAGAKGAIAAWLLFVRPPGGTYIFGAISGSSSSGLSLSTGFTRGRVRRSPLNGRPVLTNRVSRGLARAVEGESTALAAGAWSMLEETSAGAARAAKPSRPAPRQRIRVNNTRMRRKAEVVEDFFFMTRNQSVGG